MVKSYGWQDDSHDLEKALCKKKKKDPNKRVINNK